MDNKYPQGVTIGHGVEIWACCRTDYNPGQKSCPHCDPELEVMGSAVGLVRRSLEDWLLKFTQDGDTLKVHRLSGGTLAIQNQRTLVCYFLEAKDG